MIDQRSLWQPRAAVMQAIPVTALHDFLTRRGWIQKPSQYPTRRCYEHLEHQFEDGRPVPCYFPASEQLADYPLGVLQFIENYAVNWQIDPHAILAELQGGPVAEPAQAPVSA